MEQDYYQLLFDVLKYYNRTTPETIKTLRQNQIFVFGTNREGTQKGGAAGLAASRFHAAKGVKEGPTGFAYALPTRGYSLSELAKAVGRFEKYARDNTDKIFLVTAVGCGHAGFKVEQVAPLFLGCIALINVMLPVSFVNCYRAICIQKLKIKISMSQEPNKEDINSILECYDSSVHGVVRYLFDHNISFNICGGFVITDSNENVLAEAELGIESEKIVFFPFSENDQSIFIEHGYLVLTPESYLLRKN